MPDEYVRIHTKPRLAPNLAIGHIRWDRTLGHPVGNMAGGFVLDAYHYDKLFRGEFKDLPTHVRLPHWVDAWEGPHDERYYRVSFMTEAHDPRGYDLADTDPLGVLNFLDVDFTENVAWTPSALGGLKFVHPTQILFDPPSQIQVLSDIKVFEFASYPKG